MNSINIFLRFLSVVAHNIIYITKIRTPKPNVFNELALKSSLGGFNAYNLINFNQFIDLIATIFQNSLSGFNECNTFNFNQLYALLGAIMPYTLHIYLPLSHLINRIRIPSVGCSIDSSETSGIDTGNIYPELIQLPNTYIVTNSIYDLYVAWLGLINSPIINLVLIGLFVLCLRYVGILSARNNFFSVITIFMFFPRGVLGYNIIRNFVLDNNTRLIIYTLSTNVLFGIFNWLFDYLSLLHRLRGSIFFNSIYITHFILGVAYMFNINFGVLASNGTWYWGQYHNLNGGWTVMLSTLFSIILPSFWFLAGNRNVNSEWDRYTSIFRSILEVFAFNSVAFCTYIYWGFWVTHVIYYPNLIAIIVFTIIYVFVSYITIYFETFGGRPLIYGVSYWLMFTCTAMLSNGVFNLANQYTIALYIQIIIIVGLNIVTSAIYPNIYRGGVIMTRSALADAILTNNNLLNQESGHSIHLIFWHLFIYLLLFNNFVLHTGFFFPYVVIWFNLI